MNKEEIIYEYTLDELKDMTYEEILTSIQGLEKSYQEWEHLYIKSKDKYIERGEQLTQANNKIEKIREYCKYGINYYNDSDEGPIEQCEVDGKYILSIIDGNDE